MMPSVSAVSFRFLDEATALVNMSLSYADLCFGVSLLPSR